MENLNGLMVRKCLFRMAGIKSKINLLQKHNELSPFAWVFNGETQIIHDFHRISTGHLKSVHNLAAMFASRANEATC